MADHGVRDRPDTTRVMARAKVNLFLRVVGRRTDRYHDVESLVLPVTLHDELAIQAFADPGRFRTLALSLEVDGDPSLVAGVPMDESNLVLRAAQALAN